MTEKLNPSEAQRKAMALELKAFSGWTLDTCHKAVAAVIAAANSIPEGPPVGTIARRPDGGNIALREYDGEQSYWVYLYGKHWDTADSWPVIYDPTKPVPKEYPYEEGDTVVIGPECFAVPAKSVIAWQGVWYEEMKPSDPTAQQEPEDPRDYCRNCDGRKCMGCVFREYDHDCADDCPDCCTPPRTPRVVDRLGVDERDAEWTRREVYRDTYIWEYRYAGGVWRFRLLGQEHWTALTPGAEPTNGPFTEVLPDVG
ncbi:hypothetical protein [Mycobacteroides chelonae]|uniref:hypothetical protein n=1 Tax=Mycobacteroides chelonae TaxID=1774 RepID=UPI0012FF9BC1|nr:hypothetical protein [Mycobacteroides chelonae]